MNPIYRYQLLAEEKEQLRGLQDKEAFQEADSKLKEVSIKLKEANRDLCRNLRQNPNIQVRQQEGNVAKEGPSFSNGGGRRNEVFVLFGLQYCIFYIRMGMR